MCAKIRKMFRLRVTPAPKLYERINGVPPGMAGNLDLYNEFVIPGDMEIYLGGHNHARAFDFG